MIVHIVHLEWECAKYAQRASRAGRKWSSDSTNGRPNSFNYSKSVRFFCPRFFLLFHWTWRIYGRTHRTIAFLSLVLSVHRLEIFVWPTLAFWCVSCGVRCAFAYDLEIFGMHSSATLVRLLPFHSVKFDKSCLLQGSGLSCMDFLIRLCAIFRLSFVRRILFLRFLRFLLSVQTDCRLQSTIQRASFVSLQLNTLELTASHVWISYMVLIHLHCTHDHCSRLR